MSGLSGLSGLSGIFGGAAAPAGPIVSDTFDRADSTTSLGSADTGQAWTALSGTWGISTNAAYLPGSASPAVAVIDSGKADLIAIEAKIPAFGSATRIVARVSAANTHILAQGEGTAYVLYKINAGTYTALGTGSAVAPAAGDVMRLELRGDEIKMLVNGVVIYTATEALNQTVTSHGISGVTADGKRWDNFKVVDL